MVVFVPLGFVEAADVELQGFDISTVDELTAIAVIGVAFGHAGTALLGEVFYSGVVAAGVWETRSGEKYTLRQIARALPWGRLVAVDLLFALITVVGLVLLVVPGVIFLVWFSISGPVLKIEHRTPRDALRRSRELVQRQLLARIRARDPGRDLHRHDRQRRRLAGGTCGRRRIAARRVARRDTG